MLQRLSPKWRRLGLLLALPVAALAFPACLSFDEGHGQIGLTTDGGFPAVMYTIHGGLSQTIGYTVYASICNHSVSCTSNATAGQNGNDFISNEALTDCNPADYTNLDPITGQYVLCGADFDQALWNRLLTCPGGPFCGGNNTEWQSRCLAFKVSTTGAINDLLGWNINGAYFDYGSWTWFRQGNWNCQE